jgi:hypothetical protein
MKYLRKMLSISPFFEESLTQFSLPIFAAIINIQSFLSEYSILVEKKPQATFILTDLQYKTEIGNSKNYKFNFIIVLPCSKNKFLWRRIPITC